MADVKNSPRNFLEGYADLAKEVKRRLNQYETKKLGKIDSPWNRYGAGHSVGDLLLGEGPEFVDDLSYGYSPFKGGNRATGGLGTLTLDKRAIDVPQMIPATALAKMPQATMIGVIKNKGGNWLTGSVEKSLKPLKKQGLLTYNAEAGEEVVREGNRFIRRDRNGRIIEVLEHPDNPNFNPLELHPEDQAINQWIEGTLTKYIKNQMATPEDPIRLRADRLAKTAEDRMYAAKEKAQHPNDFTRARERYDDEMKGVLHSDSWLLENGTASRPVGSVTVSRKNSGFPKEGNATSELGKAWENYSDMSAIPEDAFEYLTDFTGNLDHINKKLLEENPWLDKVHPSTPVHSFDNAAAQTLGFDHLIDEIGNAISPDSDLPVNLRIKPEDLANPRKNSMESMVDLVAKINQHRYRMAIEAEKKSNEAIRDYPGWNVVKEYPDGYRMVRLPDVEDDLEAFKIGKACGEKGGWCTQGDGMLRNYGSGSSRLNILLDPDGKPVAQVETVRPIDHLVNDPDAAIDFWKNSSDEFKARYPDLEDVSASDEFYDWASKQPFNINQIKGKHNQKPKAEHIPYLQDFVKSGNFSDVSDLGNVDMENINDYRDSVINRAREAGLTGNYFTPDEIYQYLDPGL